MIISTEYIMIILLSAASVQPASFGRWPGTKWCGLGNDAASYDDLADGSYREADKCCRTHDSCDRYISPFQAKYGTFNWNFFMMSECDCDKKFYECLKIQGADDKVANGVGVFYFDKLVKKCFIYDKQSGNSKIVKTSLWSDGKWNLPSLG